MALGAAAAQSQRACIQGLSSFRCCKRRNTAFKLSAAALSSSRTSQPPQYRMQDTITLTDEEKVLFDTLLAAAEFAGCKTVLRAAGGWVRDKLLGKDSADIDIALDNMLGKTFAEKVS